MAGIIGGALGVVGGLLGKKKKRTRVQQAVSIPPWLQPYLKNAYEKMAGIEFPKGWFETQILPRLETQLGQVQRWQERGIYDPAAMEGVYRTAYAPQVAQQMRGLRKEIAGRAARMPSGAARGLSELIKARTGLEAKYRTQLPQLVGKQAEFQRGIPGDLMSMLRARTAPEEFEMKKAQAILAPAPGYFGQLQRTKETGGGGGLFG